MAPPRRSFMRPDRPDGSDGPGRPERHGGRGGKAGRGGPSRRNQDEENAIPSRELYEIDSIIKAHIEKSYESHMFAEEWRNKPEIPSSDEIMKPLPGSENNEQEERWDDYQREYQRDPVTNPNLPHNIIEGAWPSKEAYIGAHYQILREDAIASLRQSVQLVMKNPAISDTDDTCIYTHVTVKGLQLSRIGVAFRMEFSYERAGKQIRWDQSKRLLQGSIVALSPMSDMFQKQCKVAVVAARPIEGGLDQNPPTIDLFLGEIDDAFIDPVEQYVIVESRRGYFEASRHTLVAMQKLMTEKFNLQNHIVDMDADVKAPAYVEDNPFMNLSSLQRKDEDLPRMGPSEPDPLENVDALREFPKNIDCDMDESQMKACEKILTNRVAIVQGPPGTGKTFVSVSALKVMRDSLGPKDPPIVVAAQTNHALDQLLNHVLKFESNIVRLGGRCDKANEEVVARTLYNLRLNHGGAPGGKSLSQAWKWWDEEVKKIQITLELFSTGSLISAEIFLEHNFLSEDQVKSLQNSAEWEGEDESLDGIGNWLTTAQIMPIPPTPTINVDLPLEEVDIEAEQLAELEADMKAEAEGPDTKDSDSLRGEWFSFQRKFTGRHKFPRLLTDKQIKKMLATTSDLYEISLRMRGEIYRFLEKQVYSRILKELKLRLAEYDKVIKGYSITKAMCNVRLIRHLGIKIIGCTTTGLSKYRALLSALRPRTLLIEEAAETLEGSVIGGLMNSIEHLILVGDHKQLRAGCTVPELLRAPYHMEISMFERLVNNGIGYVMLNTQRRMIPEVRKLLCIQPDPFYENLVDHETVNDRVRNRPPVPGMGGIDTYFFHHMWHEGRNAEFSRFNLFEADMVVRLFYYLCQNGVPPDKITILTFYSGQKKTILTKLRQHSGLKDIRFFNVFTVDSYQGEENDVILLSLVRSNTHLGIGFLESMNRLVVALSRARRGLYMFGNSITLASQEEDENSVGRARLWRPLIEYMASHNRFNLDRGLPLTCHRHRKITEILDPIDFDKVLAGGCDQPCEGGQLRCGHPCTEPCHPYSHEISTCRAPCSKFLDCGHKCSRDCWERCCCDACDLYSHTFVQDIRESLDFPGDVGNLEHALTLYDSSPRRQIKFVPQTSFDETLDAGFESGHGYPSMQSSRRTPPGLRARKRSDSGPMLATPAKMPRSASGPLQPSRVDSYTYTPRGRPTTNPWENWNAEKADAHFAELRRREDEAAPKTDPADLVFRETWRPTTVNQKGERVRVSSASRHRTVGRVEVVAHSPKNSQSLEDYPPDPRWCPAKKTAQISKASSTSQGRQYHEQQSAQLISASVIDNSMSGSLLSDNMVLASGENIKFPSEEKPINHGSGNSGLSCGALQSQDTADLLGLYDEPLDLLDVFSSSNNSASIPRSAISGAPLVRGHVTNNLVTFEDDNLINFD